MNCSGDVDGVGVEDSRLFPEACGGFESTRPLNLVPEGPELPPREVRVLPEVTLEDESSLEVRVLPEGMPEEEPREDKLKGSVPTGSE